MKSLVDAQLPRTLARFLCDRGCDAIHTSELADSNDTTDIEINRISLAEERVVESKDSDFYDSFTAKREPRKFLHVNLGNCSNAILLTLFEKNLDTIIVQLGTASVVKVTRSYIFTIH